MCSSWGVDDERKGDRSVFGTMANGSQGFASTDDPGADAPGAGAVEWMELAGNSNSGTAAAFLDQLRQRHSGPLQVIWDNAPAHRGEAVREYLRRPGLGLRLVNLPGYSPDFNAAEAIWGWAREEATGNLCLGSSAAVQERVGSFLSRLTSRKDEVKRRCRTVLQARAEALL